MTAQNDAWLKDSPLHALTWRASRLARPDSLSVPSGWPRLDAALPDGGWPLGTLIELLLPGHGVGELSVLLPALRRLLSDSHKAQCWVTCVAPPHELHAPALLQAGLPLSQLLMVRVSGLRERLWAAEQALSSSSCVAVLAWLAEVDDRALRRLKLAAAQGKGLGVLFRPEKARHLISPAPLRLLLQPALEGLSIEILKRRGGGVLHIDGVMNEP